jgi:hypothetical protein
MGVDKREGFLLRSRRWKSTILRGRNGGREIMDEGVGRPERHVITCCLASGFFSGLASLLYNSLRERT